MRTHLWILLFALAACDDGDASPAGDAGPADSGADARSFPDTGRPDGAPSDASPPDGAMPDDAAPSADLGADGGASDAGLDAHVDGDQGVEVDAAPVPDAAAPDVPHLGECATPADCLNFRACVDGACVDPEASPFAGDLVLNEILIDGALDRDANDDGDISAVDDEFIELVNVTDDALDLSGFLVVERDLQGIPRHVFADGVALGAGEALVLFGGGSPSEALEATPGAVFTVVNAADPAFSNGLNLDDGGDTLRVLDADGHEVIVFSYGPDCARPPCAETAEDRSLTRDPDLVGEFAPHPDSVMSPGTRVDGAPFE